ncbi:MAG TPA: Crp/Fnr family transcriptional regulator [Anaerolineaceae bacterium]|nr:Crp/Fnr family transcriptional regulator [Anaerolineaceae bacterium]
MLNPVDYLKVFQSIPWFLELKPESLERLASIAQICQLAPGEVLFQEGDRSNYLYLLLDGEVNLTSHVPTHGSLQIYTAQPLDVIGWSSLTPIVRQRTANAQAVSATRLLTFDGESLRKLCEQDHDLGFIIMRRLANVVASRLLITRLQLLDLIVQNSEELANHRL